MEQSNSEDLSPKWTNKYGEIIDPIGRKSLEMRLSEENWYNFIERTFGKIILQEGDYVKIECSRNGYDIYLRKAW